jgi:hypothetical protein
VRVEEIPQGAPVPQVRWCPVCQANFNVLYPGVDHDCRKYRGALLAMRSDIDYALRRIDESPTVWVIEMDMAGVITEQEIPNA